MIIYGKQLFLHLLNKRPESFLRVFLSKEVDAKTFNKISRLGLKIERIDNKKAQALSRNGVHQGFLAEVKPFELASVQKLKEARFVAVLWGVSDVGNIGAIVRSAWALGCDGVIVLAKSLNLEGVARASSGAAFELPIALCEDGFSLLNELKQEGFSLYAASANNAQESQNTAKKVALLMGSEGEGLPSRVLKKCDKTLSVKMRREWDSLNVSVAFGILANEILTEFDNCQNRI